MLLPVALNARPAAPDVRARGSLCLREFVVVKNTIAIFIHHLEKKLKLSLGCCFVKNLEEDSF
jgi:hypothetical protein